MRSKIAERVEGGERRSGREEEEGEGEEARNEYEEFKNSGTGK
jgi:hypothetical protein